MNSWYRAIEQKVTVFYPIYFPALSYPVFVFVKINHGCLGMMQSLQYKTLSKAVLRERGRERDRERKTSRPERKIRAL